MLVQYNNELVEVSNDLVKAINEQQLVDEAMEIMPNFDLIKPIEGFAKNELLRFGQLLESEMLNNNGDTERYVLEKLGYGK